ncbi:MAG: hypothetical protein ACRDIY_13185 [Chloroflexota bacterium]
MTTGHDKHQDASVTQAPTADDTSADDGDAWLHTTADFNGMPGDHRTCWDEQNIVNLEEGLYDLAAEVWERTRAPEDDMTESELWLAWQRENPGEAAYQLVRHYDMAIRDRTRHAVMVGWALAHTGETAVLGYENWCQAAMAYLIWTVLPIAERLAYEARTKTARDEQERVKAGLPRGDGSPADE